MQIVFGRVQKIRYRADGKTQGLLLDRGIEVVTPSSQSKSVSEVAGIGSSIEVHGWTRPGPAGGMYFEAAVIFNPDANLLVSLETLPPRPHPLHHDPEVPPATQPPKEAAPLAPLRPAELAIPMGAGSLHPVGAETGSERFEPNSRKNHTESNGHHAIAALTGVAADQQGAIENIERAYAALHRTQALLAYIKILDLVGPHVGPLLNESKQTYEQALAIYEKQDFAIAAELAAASVDLARAAEILIARTLRADSSLPTLVPPPPAHHSTTMESGRAKGQLTRVRQMISRLRWLIQNGTMPSEELEQVKKITSWSDSFHGQARRFLRSGSPEDAMEFAQAASAVAHSAEHVCKQSYVMHGSATEEPTATDSSLH